MQTADENDSLLEILSQATGSETPSASTPSNTTNPTIDVEGEDGIGGNEEDIDSGAVGSRKRKISKVWKHFTVELDSAGILVGVCTYCQTSKYNALGKSGTSNYKRHLEVCKAYKNVKLKNDSDKGSGKKLDQRMYRRLMAEAILRHGYSFSWVEHFGNRKLHKYLNSNDQPISRNTIKKDCLELHKGMKSELMNELKQLPGNICFTTYLWTSINSKGYMCVTAHYINKEWKLQSKVLCFRHCPPPHGGIELLVELIDVFLEWGVEKKVFSLTVDNATNNDKMIHALKQGVLKDLMCHGKHFHIRCCAHILNLIVKDGLKVIKDHVSKVRDDVRYIEGSEARVRKFEAAANNYEVPLSGGLLLDVPTRWNSTYHMLVRAFRFRNVINYFFSSVDGGSKYILKFNQWEKIEKIISLLQPFDEVTELFLGRDYPTTNLYFNQVWKIQTRLETTSVCGDVDISVPAVEMLEKFNKYWREYVFSLGFAVILDPRFKWRFVNFALTKVHGREEGGRLANEVKFQFDELYKVYEGLNGIDVNWRDRMTRDSTLDFDGV